MENGHETIHHRSHICHNVTRYTKVTEKKVRFNIEEESEEQDKERREEETKRKRGRPRKGEEAKSDTDYTIGISSRTCSKVPLPDLAAQPSKSSLKQRAQNS